MNSSKLETIEQILEFLSGTEVMEFSVESTECYAFIQATLDKFGYGRLGKAEKGLIRRYLRKMSGCSRAQLTRLIADHRKRRRLGRRPRLRSRFPKRYLDADIGLLAHTDEVHGTLSGPATKKVLEREAEVYGHADYARLAGISVAHLYNLRKGTGYRKRRRHWTKTAPCASPSESAASPIPTDSRATCVSIRSTRATWMATKASIISMR